MASEILAIAYPFAKVFSRQNFPLLNSSVMWSYRHCSEWKATLLTMHQELGEEWAPNHCNKLFEKEESFLLFYKREKVPF